MTDRAHILARTALEHPLAQVFHTQVLRSFALSRLAGSVENTAEVARGAARAPDGGAAMADAYLEHDLEAEGRAQLERFATDAVARQALIAATWLLAAAADLGADDVEIPAELVIITAQTRPVALQRAQEQLASVRAAGGDPTDGGGGA